MIFITGSRGFVGRAMLRQASAADQVRPLPRGDAVDAIRRGRGSEPAALVHLAWPGLAPSTAGVRETSGDWEAFLEAGHALRRACAENDVAFIGIGSGVEACDEAALGEPYRSYVRRKQAMRAALSPDAWLRLHFLFGPGESPQRIVPAAIRAARDGAALVMGAPHRRRHWLCVDDLARILLDFAAAPASGQWDICGREAFSFTELVTLVETAVGRPVRTAEPAAAVADASLDLVSPQALAPNLPDWAGRRPNLLARLAEYADWIAGGEDQER